MKTLSNVGGFYGFGSTAAPITADGAHFFHA
jgi:hypothetical protein